jgi:hypothetical protein
MVPAADLDAARQVISDWEAADPEADDSTI